MLSPICAKYFSSTFSVSFHAAIHYHQCINKTVLTTIVSTFFSDSKKLSICLQEDNVQKPNSCQIHAAFHPGQTLQQVKRQL